MAAFALISSLPHQALAFSEETSLSTTPLVFERDTEMSDASLLASSEIPLVTGPLTPGTKIRLLATAYSSSVGQTDSNPYRTASGTTVHPGTLAANFLPFGAAVQINGENYTVEDRLNERYNDRAIVDVWFSGQAEAFAFGVRVVELEVLSLP